METKIIAGESEFSCETADPFVCTWFCVILTFWFWNRGYSLTDSGIANASRHNTYIQGMDRTYGTTLSLDKVMYPYGTYIQGKSHYTRLWIVPTVRWISASISWKCCQWPINTIFYSKLYESVDMFRQNILGLNLELTFNLRSSGPVCSLIYDTTNWRLGVCRIIYRRIMVW